MSERTKEIVNDIANKNLNNAKEKVHNELIQRAADKIDQMKPEVMSKVFTQQSPTDDES